MGSSSPNPQEPGRRYPAIARVYEPSLLPIHNRNGGEAAGLQSHTRDQLKRAQSCAASLRSDMPAAAPTDIFITYAHAEPGFSTNFFVNSIP